MSKITLIGAGSAVFTRNLCSDILLVPALQGSTISLMDIDADRLRNSSDLVQNIVDHRGLDAMVEATTDRREAIRGADYVVTMFQQSGLDPYTLDIEIPKKYGVEQCVGDTLGPGGVFRALRTIPVLLDLCDEMDELAPDALLLNYVNPMAANCWAVDLGAGRPHVGLSHSVQGTSEMLASWTQVPYDEVNFRKSARMVEDELVPRFENEDDHWFDFGRTGGYLRHCLSRLEESPDGHEPVPTERTHEYGSYIIEAVETDGSIKINGNVPNRGLIRSLPENCCVEVPCLVDANGIQPTAVEHYPLQLVALNRTNINVQELTVEAALTGDVEAVHHAVILDPLTAAVCTLPEIHSMVDEMLEARARWLPQFAGIRT